ncbi:MAG: o-succinylbenzoate--CoA ligase [Chloroflexi bacterium]|nr:o-succinylbenzoate--CoA ligase [Chloroflexota bacterium]
MRDWLRRSAQLSGDLVALRSAGRVVRFGELDGEVDRVVGHLSHAGVAKGEWVGVFGGTSIDLVLILLALARLGAVAVPVNVRWSRLEVARVVGEYGVVRWFVDGDIDGLGLGSLVFDYTKFTHEKNNTPGLPPTPVPLEYDTVACAVFTSGTSGTPKAVQITYGSLIHNAALTALRLRVHHDDHWLCCLPLFHVGGLVMLFRSIISGTSLSLHERFDVDAVNYAIDHDAITHVSLVPTMLARLLDARTSPPPRPVTVLLGGAAASTALIERARRINLDVLSTYGLTEATSQAATQTPGDPRIKVGSAGKSVPFVTVSVRSEDGAMRPAGEIGDIYVKGPTVMKGYANDPAATESVLTPYGLRTGDLGYLDADGDLWIVNRRTDLIISGGENIYPAEVEAALLQIPGIRAACVVAVDDPVWGQSPAAAVVSDRTLSLDDVRAELNPILARYKHPKRLEYVDALPLLANGKVDRKAVASRFEDGPDR